MTRLSQVVAVEKGVRNTAHTRVTQLHRDSQKATAGGPMTGIDRSYEPRDQDGERLPGESVRVQITVDDLVAQLTSELTRLWDVTATRDWANREVGADVVFDGQILIRNCPVPYLLFLEKQLQNIRTFVANLPTLDPSDVWHFDEVSASYRSEPIMTTRSKKVPRNHVLAPATREHPAQVTTFTEDVVVGDWKTVRFSGAIPEVRRRELLDRVERLQQAVKYAREEANATEIDNLKVAKQMFDALFAA